MTARHYTYFKRKIDDINRVRDANQEAIEIRDLRAISYSLNDVRIKLTESIEEISILAELTGLNVSEQDFVLNGKKEIAKIKKEFGKKRNAQSLKANTHFVNLKDVASKAISAKDRTLKQAKIDFERTQLSDCDPPLVLKSKLVMTKANKEAFAKYKTAFDEFKNVIEKLEVSEFKGAVSGLKEKSKAIRVIFSSFETSYPDFVNDFLNAVQNNRNMMPLSSLTAEQLEWLKENKLAEQYIISPEAHD